MISHVVRMKRSSDLHCCVSIKFTLLAFIITKSDVDQFLPLDATQSAVMRLRVVRLSVCLSVTFRYRDNIC